MDLTTLNPLEIEYGQVDKEGWGPGPWHEEPDVLHWVDPVTGYHCHLCRNYHAGSLCGYVIVPTQHPLCRHTYNSSVPKGAIQEPEWMLDDPEAPVFQLFLNAIGPEDDHVGLDCLFKVHGGLTYSGTMRNISPIWKGWAFGFDCGHGGLPGDLMPGLEWELNRCYAEQGKERPTLHLEPPWGPPIYREVPYVVEQCHYLAAQLLAWGHQLQHVPLRKSPRPHRRNRSQKLKEMVDDFRMEQWDQEEDWN